MKDTGVQRERKLKSDGLPQVVKREAAAFWEDESGVGVIEIVLILVVLIGLVIIFKEQINKLLETIFKEINSQSKEVYKGLGRREIPDSV